MKKSEVSGPRNSFVLEGGKTKNRHNHNLTVSILHCQAPYELSGFLLCAPLNAPFSCDDLTSNQSSCVRISVCSWLWQEKSCSNEKRRGTLACPKTAQECADIKNPYKIVLWTFCHKTTIDSKHANPVKPSKRPIILRRMHTFC